MQSNRIERESSQLGFSLIELLIVVAIILIIAAIAIPNLLRARRSANEGSATASMRTIGSGELLYNSTNGSFGTLAQLSADSRTANAGAKGLRGFSVVSRSLPEGLCGSLNTTQDGNKTGSGK